MTKMTPFFLGKSRHLNYRPRQPQKPLLKVTFFFLLASIFAFQLGRFLERQNIPLQPLPTPTSTPTPSSNAPTQRGPSLSQVEAMQAELQTAEAKLTEVAFQFEIFGVQAVYTNLEVAALRGTGTAVAVSLPIAEDV